MMHTTSSIPIEFIDSLDDRQHLMLFYEDSEYARLVEFIFLKRGLEKGESCVYATDEDSGAIVLRLLRYGMSLEDFQSKRIQVFQIQPISGNSEEMLAECKKEIIRILSKVKRPFRIVSRIVSDITTVKGMSVELEMERLVHDYFEDLDGTIMCPYDMSKMENTKKFEWIKDLYSCHHAVIYIPKDGECGVICPR